MMMKKIVSAFFALALVLSLSHQLEAQNFGAPDHMKGKVVVGGNADLGFAYDCFYIGIAPQAGLRIIPSLEVGARLGYDLRCFLDTYESYYYHFIAGALYANYEILSGIYVQVEDEEMCSLIRSTGTGMLEPIWTNSVFVGGGYRQYFDKNSFFFYSVLYNLSWDYTYGTYSPYASPFVIRVGYCKGF